MSISQLKHVKNLKFFREMPLKISDLIEILPDFEIIVKKVGTLQVSTPRISDNLFGDRCQCSICFFSIPSVLSFLSDRSDMLSIKLFINELSLAFLLKLNKLSEAFS